LDQALGAIKKRPHQIMMGARLLAAIDDWQAMELVSSLKARQG